MSGTSTLIYGDDDEGGFSIYQMQEQQRQFLQQGGWARKAVAQLAKRPYVHQDYPKHVRLDGHELGIAEDAAEEARMLEAHVHHLEAERVRLDAATEKARQERIRVAAEAKAADLQAKRMIERDEAAEAERQERERNAAGQFVRRV